MSYSGEVLNACGVINIDFSSASVVAVSGDGPNICGHLMLLVGGRGGYYFHVAEFRGYPRYMNNAGYRRYLSEAGKTELRRIPVNIPNPNEALIYLEQMMSEKWTWLVIPNNCVSFVEEVLAAGGADWASASNCPALATAPTISERVQSFLNRLEAEIYGIYGMSPY